MLAKMIWFHSNIPYGINQIEYLFCIQFWLYERTWYYIYIHMKWKSSLTPKWSAALTCFIRILTAIHTNEWARARLGTHTNAHMCRGKKKSSIDIRMRVCVCVCGDVLRACVRSAICVLFVYIDWSVSNDPSRCHTYTTIHSVKMYTHFFVCGVFCPFHTEREKEREREKAAVQSAHLSIRIADSVFMCIEYNFSIGCSKGAVDVYHNFDYYT